MDIFEKLNKAFAGWYESWFGDSVGDMRPKDVLRKIIGVMEDNRKEGLDNRIYVPNKYILQIAFGSDNEREYLLAFLEKDDLEAALTKYMSQNKYNIRGALDFTIEETQPAEGEERPEKLKVICKWDTTPIPKDQPADSYIIPELAESPQQIEQYEEEEYTVAATDIYDAGTVSPPVLRVKHVDGTEKQFILSKPKILIGRSKRLNNDLIIDQDGMISKRHAKIVLEDDGYAIHDLNSTNGVWMNDEKVSIAPLKNGDIIRLGATEIVFEEAVARRKPETAELQGEASRPMLVIDMPNRRVEKFRLPSETVIGKALTSDIHIDHSSVSRKHARIISHDGIEYFIEELGSETGTRVNGHSVGEESPVLLHQGDRIKVGEVDMRYELG